LRGFPRNVGWQYAKVRAGVMGPIVEPTVIINIPRTGIATTAAEDCRRRTGNNLLEKRSFKGSI
jgi:hypothetical protein